MQPDLPETYYLDNVHTLFAHVRRVYADILDDATLGFLDRFDELGDDARKLCIRLLNRSHDLYRQGKLDYREIESLPAAVAELVEHGFIELNRDIGEAELLALYTLPELRAQMSRQQLAQGVARLRRGELEAWLLEQQDENFFDGLRRADDLLRLTCRDQYQRCQMLFFGNLNQSMTDFVLSDLGLYQYENYPIDPEHRPYRSHAEIEQHWLLYQLQTLLELIDNNDSAALGELCRLIPADIDREAPAFRKSEQLRYEIARQLERLGDLDTAVKLYRQCLLPPSRERRVRIHAQCGKERKALELCERIIARPLDEQELQFACQFALRLCKRHGYAEPAEAARLRITHQPEIVELELDYDDSVEAAVAEYYRESEPGSHCVYVENSLFNGVLGLLLWEVIFAPLPGAFYNPFQYRPADFYTHDFLSRRRRLLARTWKSIGSNDDIRRIVGKRWRQKQGLMNPLVNWQGVDLELIELALARIDHAHWRAIFDRILKDLRNNRSGFPDLVHFPADGGYCLVEVKGPGDSLQKNQQRWMQHFAEHGIPHRIARVTWRNR
jgi:hypothetical protein